MIFFKASFDHHFMILKYIAKKLTNTSKRVYVFHHTALIRKIKIGSRENIWKILLNFRLNQLVTLIFLNYVSSVSLYGVEILPTVIQALSA